MLAQSVRESNTAEGDIDEIAKRLLVNLETLPDRIASAISDALAKQHRLIIRDVRAAMSELVSDPDTAVLSPPVLRD